jgi:hypothetical protein
MLLTQPALFLGNVYDLVLGFGLGAATFGLAQHLIRHRIKGDEKERQRKIETSDGKLSIIGTVLDSVPETLFVGIITFLRHPGFTPLWLCFFLGI